MMLSKHRIAVLKERCLPAAVPSALGRRTGLSGAEILQTKDQVGQLCGNTHTSYGLH